MKPAPFQMHTPQSQGEILLLLDQYGEDARILAGGQTLIPALAMRVASPEHLIDINRVSELKRIQIEKNTLHVGAGVRQTELETWDRLSSVQPLLKKMFPWIAHAPIRNRGTVCGSIAHADPSAELVLALAVLDGSVMLASKKSIRTVKAGDFFIGALQTSREANELIVGVQFPIHPDDAGFGFSEYGYRHGDFAVVSVAVVKKNADWAIGFGGIDDTVKVFHTTANSLDEVEKFIENLVVTIDVREDPTATSGLRRHLMRTLGRQACRQAMEMRRMSMP